MSQTGTVGASTWHPQLGPLVFLVVFGCGAPPADPMPQARADLTADLADGVLTDSTRELTLADDTITSRQVDVGSHLCLGLSVIAGLFASAVALANRGMAIYDDVFDWRAPDQVFLAGLFVATPALGGVALGAWMDVSTDLVVDLRARTVTRTAHWPAGYDRVEVRALDDLTCATREQTLDDDEPGDQVTSCDAVLAPRDGWFRSDWMLLSYPTCPPAEALCEHLTAAIR